MSRSSKRAASLAASNAEIEGKKAKIASHWYGAGETVKTKGGNEIHQLAVYDHDGCLKSDTIYAFDVDWTIIKPKSGKKFPQGANDWTFLFDEVPKKLKTLHETGIKIVFVTNQAGVEKGKTSITELQTKFRQILDHLEFEVTILACTGENHFRKPSVRLWEYFVANCNDGIKPDLTKCKFIGDAAGRAKGWSKGKPKDFNASDRMFAENIGIDFETPEEFFLGQTPVPYTYGSVDPSTLIADKQPPLDTSILQSNDIPEMVVMVGMPASGKSTISSNHFVKKLNYVRINRDEMGSKCKKLAEAALKEDKSVVIDNTNPAPSKRKEWIQLAAKYKVPVRCIFMTTERKVAEHLNQYRQVISEGKHRRVPAVAYNSYNKYFEEPSQDEGFTQVIKIPFVPHFEEPNHRRIFLHWTVS